MPCRPRDHPQPTIGAFLLLLILVLTVANAQQQHDRLSNHHDAFPHLLAGSKGKSTWSEDNESSYKPLRGNSGSSDGQRKQQPHPKQYEQTTKDVRALATLAPALDNAPSEPARAVRAPPASGPAAGSLSRTGTRSLQDWEVEDIVLLATVDGSIHARDRKTGAPRWTLEADKPMVETTYHPRNKSGDSEGDLGVEDILWIVEPSQDGALYAYTPGASLGMQKLGLTVKGLDDLSPYETEDPPLNYISQKKNTLYTVDVSSGNFVNVFSTDAFAAPNLPSCRRVDVLGGVEEDECGVTGTLTLGRTEYTVTISDSITGKPISTIRYSEWGPNKRDRDLHDQYLSSKDNRYIYSMHDGRILALDHLQHKDSRLEFANRPTFRQKLESPVARVFDVARFIHDGSPDAPLVILPQPIGPTADENPLFNDEQRVFVNCTESGSWYALSENSYPMVTRGAFQARCASEGWQGLSQQQGDFSLNSLRDALVGVHALSYGEAMSKNIPLIGAPHSPLGIDQPGVRAEPSAMFNPVPTKPRGSFWIPDSSSTFPTLSTVVLIIAALSYVKLTSRRPFLSWLPDMPKSSDVTPIVVPEPTAEALASSPDQKKPEDVPKIVTFADETKENEDPNQKSTENLTALTQEGVAPKKKKAHRGKRGGKSVREKQQQNPSDEVSVHPDTTTSIVEGVKQIGQDVTVKPDVIQKNSSSELNGPTGLHNLTIHTDHVLGNGSGGTFVFEGEFEGRDVAVKRMLPQYYELASQEVTLLEQSEDHPNVIRYFCRREDQHFLYIALELCQASLWDLFRDGRRDEIPDEKFGALTDQVVQDPRRVLRQLAEGVKYLHSFRIVHRDIKPQNMLITYPKKNNLGGFPRFVISDFGLCKTLPEDVSTLIGTTGNAGTAGWKAPELIFQPRETSGSQLSTGANSLNGDSSTTTMNTSSIGISGVKRAVDIFSLGCVFFYVLTRGQHPFDDEEGWMQLRERNIKTSRANLAPLDIFGPDTIDLTRWMLSPRPEDRPTAAQVLAHPFFWEAEERLEFLAVASDRFDQETRDPPSAVLLALEAHAEDVIPKAVAGPAASQASSAAAHGHLRQRSSSPQQLAADLSNGTPPIILGAGSHHPATATHLPVPEPNFLAALDRRFVDTLGRQRKYHPARVADLLRALRNKYHHWDDMPEEVQARVGEVPEGYLRYWEGRFPALLVRVWRVLGSTGVGREKRFARWFGGRGG